MVSFEQALGAPHGVLGLAHCRQLALQPLENWHQIVAVLCNAIRYNRERAFETFDRYRLTQVATPFARATRCTA